MLLGADFGGLKIRVSVVPFRPWPPSKSEPYSDRRVGLRDDASIWFPFCLAAPSEGAYRWRLTRVVPQKATPKTARGVECLISTFKCANDSTRPEAAIAVSCRRTLVPSGADIVNSQTRRVGARTGCRRNSRDSTVGGCSTARVGSPRENSKLLP